MDLKSGKVRIVAGDGIALSIWCGIAQKLATSASPTPIGRTIVGAVSLEFTRTLVRDILSVPELANIELALADISSRNLSMIAEIVKRIVKASRLDTTFVATMDRREAIRGAKYIISCVRVGGLDAFAHDIEIPLKYWVDQCVGDKICAGGIVYAQTGIRVTLGICEDIREVAAPRAKFIDCAIPLAMKRFGYYSAAMGISRNICRGIGSVLPSSPGGSMRRTESTGRQVGFCGNVGPTASRTSRNFRQMVRKASIPVDPVKRSFEHASYILQTFEAGRFYRGDFSVRNAGIISNLPQVCDRRIGQLCGKVRSICVAGSFCPMLVPQHAMLRSSARVWRSGAAVTGDIELLKQSVLHDLLVGAVCRPSEVWQMVDEMLVARATWLPQDGPAMKLAEDVSKIAWPVKRKYGWRERYHKVATAARSAKAYGNL